MMPVDPPPPPYIPVGGSEGDQPRNRVRGVPRGPLPGPATPPPDDQAVPTAGEEATIAMPAHHLVEMDLGFICTNCGGHTSTTAPCIPAKDYPLTPATPPDDDASEGGASC